MSDKLLKKAINKHKAGQHAAARSLYQKILKSNPGHIDANYMLGTLYAEQGDSNSALKYMKIAEQLAPDSQYIKNNLGNIYRMQGELEAAADCYNGALLIQPDMVEALNNLAIVQRRLNQPGQAIDLYRAAIAQSPNFIEAHYNLGKAYWDEDQPDNARVCFERVLEINPEHPLASFELGNFYMKRGEKDNAIRCFEQYLSLVDEDTNGARLKIAYLKDGDIPERQPESLIIQTYEKKARTWDVDVERSDIAFLGPGHIRQAMDQYLVKKAELLILDIGCGTGLCGPFLKPLSTLLHGVDVSEHMLKVARTKQIYDQLFCDDIERYMNSSAQQYDLITASGVLIFFGELSRVLEAAYRVLMPDGMMVFTLYRSNDKPVEIRDNMHFAHSETYIRDIAAKLSYDIVAVDPVVHEYEKNLPQPGFVISLKKG